MPNVLTTDIYHCYSIDQLEAALENNGVMIAGPGATGSFPRIDLDATYTSLGQFRWSRCPVDKSQMQEQQKPVKGMVL